MPGSSRLLDSIRVLRAALIVVAIPFLMAFVSIAAAGDVGPRNHDVALIELRSNDVLGGDTPLVGSYERFGGNQPGPWMFWILAVPALAGPLGIAMATLCVGYGATAGMLWVARRRGGSLLVLWTALLATLLSLGRGVDRLADPWEPMITLFVIGLVVMLVWEVAAGTQAAIPWAVAIMWFLASSWILLTTVVLCLGLVLAAAVSMHVWTAVRSGDPVQRRRIGGWLAVAAAVVAVMALPTFIEQLTSNPGNLSELRAAATSAEPTVGLAEAGRVLRLQFGARPLWLGASVPLTFTSEVDGASAPAVPIAVIVWAASMVALFVSGRRAGRSELGAGSPDGGQDSEPPDLLSGTAALWWMHLGVGATVVGLLLGLSFSRGGVAVWSMEPTSCAAMLVWLVTGWTTAVLVLRHRPATWSARLAVVLAASLVVAAGIASVLALRTDQALDPLPAAVSALADGVASKVPSGSGPLLVTSDAHVDQVFDSGDFGVAELAASLERDGYRTVVDERLADKFGGRRATPGDATGELRIESGDVAPSGAGWTLVRRVDPMSAADRERRSELDREIAAASGGAQGADLLRKAAADPDLAALVRESFSLPSDPPLSLWYRPTP